MGSEIAVDFRTVPCNEYCQRIADGTHDSPKEAEHGRRLVTSKNVKNGRLVLDSAYLISEAEFNEINRRSKVDQWDLLLTMIGTVGEVCVVEQAEPDFTIKNVGLLKCGAEHRAKWLYYFLRSPQGQGLIEQRKKGSTQQYISLSEIRNLPISFPNDEANLRGMVSVLSLLDDRITLLREANATLEAIAQALFKSWFVDFDPVRAKMEGRAPEGMDEATAALFPDSLEETELGVVPRGWRVGTVANLGEVICGKTPPTSNPENYGDEVPFITIPDMHGFLVVTATNRSLSRTGADGQKKKYLPPGTVCVSCIATPGLVIRVTTESQTNQQINSVVPFSSWGKSFPLFLLRRIGDAVRAGGSGGSVFHNLSKSGFEELKVPLTSSEVAHMFDEFVEPLTARIESNQRQAQTLSTLRDTLLPRLISGQLSLDIAAGAKVEHHA